MRIDIGKLTVTLQQVVGLAQLGFGLLQMGAAEVARVKAASAARGYTIDTFALDDLIADAERRKNLAEQEARATE